MPHSAESLCDRRSTWLVWNHRNVWLQLGFHHSNKNIGCNSSNISIDCSLLVWKLWKKLGVLKLQAGKSVTDYKPTKKEVHKDKCGCSRHPLSSRKQKQQQNKHKLVIISRNLAVNYFSHFSLVSWEYFPLLANISSFCRSALGYPFPSRLYLI